jgi:NNP family nitrate/nitrite transporter-like MFS transporter
MGNVVATVTKFLAPNLMAAEGWHTVAFVWAGALAVGAILFYVFADNDPNSKARLADRRRSSGRS